MTVTEESLKALRLTPNLTQHHVLTDEIEDDDDFDGSAAPISHRERYLSLHLASTYDSKQELENLDVNKSSNSNKMSQILARLEIIRIFGKR